MELQLGPDSKEKVYSILRSLFRYGKLLEMNAPDILFDNESRMIKKRIGSLNAAEIFLAINSWEEFSRDQAIKDEIQNKELDVDLNRYLSTIN